MVLMIQSRAIYFISAISQRGEARDGQAGDVIGRAKLGKFKSLKELAAFHEFMHVGQVRDPCLMPDHPDGLTEPLSQSLCLAILMLLIKFSSVGKR
jgi:hypothetical protein